MKHTIAALLIGGFVAASLSAAPVARGAGVLTMSSSAVADNGTLAVKNACADKQRSPNCVGENLSPPFAWENVPEGTKSFALIMVDPEGRAPAGVNHMVIYGIPADIKGFAEGELSQPSDKYVGGKSTMEKSTYWGPGTPPNTDWHHYTFVLPVQAPVTEQRPTTSGSALERRARGARVWGRRRGHPRPDRRLPS